MKLSFAILALIGYSSAITIHQLAHDDKPSAAEEAKAAADKENAGEKKPAPPATDGPE